jgi:hypothetical protein
LTSRLTSGMASQSTLKIDLNPQWEQYYKCVPIYYNLHDPDLEANDLGDQHGVPQKLGTTDLDLEADPRAGLVIDLEIDLNPQWE